MNIQISKWYGRLGNNIIQLCNVVWLAKIKQCNITYIPEHPLINTQKIINKIKQNSSFKPTKTFRLKFFLMKDVYEVLENDPIQTPTLLDYKTIMHEVIYDSLCSSIKASNNDIMDEKTAVIHIRSGDCFKNNTKKPHPKYVPLPLNYFTMIIDDNYKEWNNIIIVTEPDQINPVIKQIVHHIYKNYKHINVTIQSSTLENDIKTILSAQNLILSIGYFSQILSILSRNVKRLFYSNYLVGHSKLPDIIECYHYRYDILEYIKIGQWKDTRQQRRLLLTHDKVKHV